MSPATTLVLPTLRECPPTTTMAMSVESQLSRRTRFPSAMDPDPLVRVLAHALLKRLSKECRVGDGVSFGITRTNETQRRFKADAILSCFLIPKRECRHYGSIRLQGNARHAAGGAGGYPEEI